MWGSHEKNLGQKINVIFFRVNPYMLGNRIPRAFQNLSDLHVWCHCEKFYIGFCPKIFLGVTIHVESPKKILGQKVSEKG